MKAFLLVGGFIGLTAAACYWCFHDIEAMFAFGILAIISLMFAGFVRIEEIIKTKLKG